MNNCRKVVIAVNGDKDVLIQGLRLVHNEKCDVTVVKVIPHYEGDLSMVGVGNLGSVLNSGSEKEISEITEIAKTEGAKVKIRLEEGDIDKKIVEAAEEESADLIIMGGKKHNFIEKFLDLDTIDKVTGHVSCPVLLVNR
jgi:nucleotide-binding universal stress UspA family protein